MVQKIQVKGLRFNPGNHRYTIDGKYAVAVSTALKGIPKYALVNWAAGLVGAWAVDNVWELKRMIDRDGEGPAKNYLRGLPDQVKNTAGVRGTAVHDHAEQISLGQEVEVPDPLVPYVEAYLAFLSDWNPTTLHAEIMVGSREHGYAGRLDSIQEIPGLGTVLVDYKTGRGVYGETALQCAAYRHAEFCVIDGVEQPMIPVDASYVLHIREGEYAFRPLVTDDDAFDRFLTAKANYMKNVQSRKLDKLIGERAEPPGRDL